jgi:hypothetical protein
MPSSGLNEGFSNTLTLREESGIGIGTGTAYRIPGAVSFRYEPVFIGQLPAVNVWRMPDGDSFAASFINGSLDCELSLNEAFSLLLTSLMEKSGAGPFTFKPAHHSNRKSLQIGLSYLPGGKEFIFKGAVIDALRIEVRPRQLLKLRVEFKAAIFAQDGPIASPTVLQHVAIPGTAAVFSYRGFNNPRVSNAQINCERRVEMQGFNEAGVASQFQPVAPLAAFMEFSEWLAESGGTADTIAGDVRAMAEASASVVITHQGKSLAFSMPRVIARAGTPPGLGRVGLNYDVTLEAQVSDTLVGIPQFTLTL